MQPYVSQICVFSVSIKGYRKSLQLIVSSLLLKEESWDDKSLRNFFITRKVSKQFTTNVSTWLHTFYDNLPLPPFSFEELHLMKNYWVTA